MGKWQAVAPLVRARLHAARASEPVTAQTHASPPRLTPTHPLPHASPAPSPYEPTAALAHARTRADGPQPRRGGPARSRSRAELSAPSRPPACAQLRHFKISTRGAADAVLLVRAEVSPNPNPNPNPNEG